MLVRVNKGNVTKLIAESSVEKFLQHGWTIIDDDIKEYQEEEAKKRGRPKKEID